MICSSCATPEGLAQGEYIIVQLARVFFVGTCDKYVFLFLPYFNMLNCCCAVRPSIIVVCEQR